MALYTVVTLLHLFVEGFEMALIVRGVSGFVSAATSTLAVLYMLQAFPKAKLGAGLVVGMTIAQFATPLAWLLSPSMLDLGDWRTLYQFEAAGALTAQGLNQLGACWDRLRKRTRSFAKVPKPRDDLGSDSARE